MSFDVDKALKAWEENFPEKGERIVVLRGMLYDCESERKVGRQGVGAKDVYLGTANNLRLMLAVEGREVS